MPTTMSPTQIMPGVTSGLSGMKDTPMSSASMAMSRKVGKKSFTSVRSEYSIFCLSLRKTMRRYAVAARAAICTIQNMPILPSITKKSMKLMPTSLPSMMEVVSPTRVAAP